MAHRNLIQAVHIAHTTAPNQSSGTFRFSRPGWHVIKETWQGSTLLNTSLLGTFTSKEAADDFRTRYRQENKRWL